MVKYIHTKQELDLSTTHSLCSESDLFPPETLTTIIDKMPKLTPAERRQTIRTNHCAKNNSKKWSQTQTKLFYQLLRHYGVDFTLISYHPHFSNRRSQKELSNKYKKQLKINPFAINNILNKIDQEGLYNINKASSHQ